MMTVNQSMSELRASPFWDNWSPNDGGSLEDWTEDCSMSGDELSSYCVCRTCIEQGCFWCCPKFAFCCFCGECTSCWSKDWGLITATQISIFILFLLGIIAVMVMYFRVCRRSTRIRSPTCLDYSRRAIPRNQLNGSPLSGEVPYHTRDLPRDRPPSYTEACSAPPIYDSPFNRVSMLEAPPVYPDTPKPSEREPHLQDATAPVANHI